MPAKQTNLDATDNGPIDFTTGAIDFSGVSTEFEPMEKGFYPGIITEAIEAVGQTSGKPYLSVTVDLDGSNRKAWPNLSFSEGALWRTKRTLLALGIDLSKPMTPAQICNELKNRRCIVHLDIEGYTNNMGEPARRNVVKDVLGPDAAVQAGAVASTASSW